MDLKLQNSLTARLAIDGFFLDGITPDGKMHRFSVSSDDEGRHGFYICYRQFSPSTAQEFCILFWGDFSKSLDSYSQFCTLADDSVDMGVRTVLNDKEKKAKKIINVEGRKVIKAFDSQASEADISVSEESGYIHALGYSDKDYFFTSSQNRLVSAVTHFSENELLKLMDEGFWRNKYMTQGGNIAWTTAKSDLISACHRRGIFQPRNIRGSGVWVDDGRTVIHMGDHLIVDGERQELGEFKSRYFYTLGANLSRMHDHPLAAGDCDLLVDTCSSFKWIKPEYSFLVAGALVVSRVCGSIPIRPHLWITGGAQTGKSTLLEKLLRPMLGANRLYVHGNTTEAGIRQALRADAIPLLFDEFETTGKKSQEIVSSVIDLLRVAWSESDAMVVKGSSGGIAAYFTIRCCAIVSSIRTKLTNDADKSRFAIIELAPHGNDEEHYKKLLTLLAQIDAEYGDRLFARTIRLLPVLLANYKMLKLALARKVSQRFGDQYGMLLAGYSILMQDEPLTLEEAEKLVEGVQLTDEKEEAKIADHDDCMSHLMTKTIVVEYEEDNKVTRVSMSIGSAVSRAMTPGGHHEKETLQEMGIRVSSDTVAISSNHHELEARVFANSNWSKTWAKSLLRLPGAFRAEKPVKVGGYANRPVCIPTAHFKS